MLEIPPESAASAPASNGRELVAVPVDSAITEYIKHLWSESTGDNFQKLLVLLSTNPGGMIGLGIGGYIGLMAMVLGLMDGKEALFSMICGGLIGHGSYRLHKERTEKKVPVEHDE